MSDNQKNQEMSQEGAAKEYSPEDIEKNKTMAGLAYILFFLPLLACPDSRFGRFHANQGLLLLIVSIAGNIILGIIPFIGWMLYPLFSAAVLIVAVISLINAINGKAKELPVIGRYRLLK